MTQGKKRFQRQQKNPLEDWGKAVGNWFQGGNLNNRLLKKGIIKKDGINDKREDLFYLTGKEENVAKKLIEKINWRCERTICPFKPDR